MLDSAHLEVILGLRPPSIPSEIVKRLSFETDGPKVDAFGSSPFGEKYRAIFRFIEKNGPSTSREASEATGVCLKTAQGACNSFLKDGYVEIQEIRVSRYARERVYRMKESIE